MSSIKVPDIKAGDRFWHNGELYTATADAWSKFGNWYTARTDAGVLTLHRGGAVLRAGSEDR